MQEGSLHPLLPQACVGARSLLSLPWSSPPWVGAGVNGWGGALGMGFLAWLRWELTWTLCLGFWIQGELQEGL